MALEPGELTVILHDAQGLKNCDWFVNQDPYVILRCGSKEFKSNTHNWGGSAPKWDQQFVFKVTQETTLVLEVYDEDKYKDDDFVGKGEVNLWEVRHAPRQKKDIQVQLYRHSGRQKGTARLTLEFSPCCAPREQRGGGASFSGAFSLASGASAAAGTAAPNALPDSVPWYEPTCGLINPHTGNPLSCHGDASGSGMTTVASAHPGSLPHGVSATPPPAAACATASTYDTSTYPHAVDYNLGSQAGAVMPPPPSAFANPYLAADNLRSNASLGYLPIYPQCGMQPGTYGGYPPMQPPHGYGYVLFSGHPSTQQPY